MPELDAAAPDLAQRGVGVLALSVAPEPDAVRAAAQKLGLHMPVAFTEQEMLGPNALRSVPSVLYVDAQGRVVDAADGRQRPERVKSRAAELFR